MPQSMPLPFLLLGFLASSSADDATGHTPMVDPVYHPDLARGFASACFTQQEPRFQPPAMIYPPDAQAHYDAIHAAYATLLELPEMQRLRRTWAGVETKTWTPEVLQGIVSEAYGDRDARSLQLHEVYGPYIPLFFQWTAIHRTNPKAGDGHDRDHTNRYPAAFLRFLRETLRPEVLYITAVQSARGLAGSCEIGIDQFPNLVILSAGGYGHVPIPLYPKPGTWMALANQVPVAERTYLASFVGSVSHAPHGARFRMVDAMGNASAAHGFVTMPKYKGDGWKDIMAQSRVSFAPRGFGRTAYHLAETVWAGLIPVHVYSDVPWVPYRTFFERDVGFVVHMDAVEAFLERIHGMPADDFAAREAKMPQIYETYFTSRGVAVQMLRMMLGQDHMLECHKIPASVRDGVESPPRHRDFDGASQFYPETCQ